MLVAGANAPNSARLGTAISQARGAGKSKRKSWRKGTDGRRETT